MRALDALPLDRHGRNGQNFERKFLLGEREKPIHVLEAPNVSRQTPPNTSIPKQMRAVKRQGAASA